MMELQPIDTPPVTDVPVYSLATLNINGREDDNKSGVASSSTTTNMNILTYASPVGIRPHRVWALSLYRTTRTHANWFQHGGQEGQSSGDGDSGASEAGNAGEGAGARGVLQLLRRGHAPVVQLLGGESGRDVDKAEGCAAAGFPWRPAAVAEPEPEPEPEAEAEAEADSGSVEDASASASASSSSSSSSSSLPSSSTTTLSPLCPPLRLLPGCAAYYAVEQQGPAVNCGDHDVVFVRLTAILDGDSLDVDGNNNNNNNNKDQQQPAEAESKSKDGSSSSSDDEASSLAMTTAFLRAEGIISAAGRANPPTTTTTTPHATPAPRAPAAQS